MIAMLDLRLPVGGLLTLLGALLAGYGLAHGADPALRPTGIPIVTVWGTVMVVVGGLFLHSARRAVRRDR
ncbi:MAG: hypothetical protein ACHQXA_04725 [Gemmatimonadales bacterium]